MSKQQREKVYESYLKYRVEELGGFVRKYTSPSRRGVPDRIVFLPGGIVVFVEAKTPIGRLSALQKNELTKLVKIGCVVRVISSKEEVDTFISSYLDTFKDAVKEVLDDNKS